MDNRREPLIVTALVAGLLGIGAAQPAAETDARPTLAVVSFKGTNISTETGDAMADELAAQFVETGRYRVMPRSWLMPSDQSAHAPLAALREAAAAARIQYLVLGEARHGMSLGSTRRDVLFIDVRVISVATGDVVRTAAGRSQTQLRTTRRAPVMSLGGPRRPAGVLGHMTVSAGLANQARHSSPSAPTVAPALFQQPPVLSTTAPAPQNISVMHDLLALLARVHRARNASKAGSTVPPAPPVVKGGWEQPLADIARSITLPSGT